MKQISALFVFFILLFTSCNNGQSSDNLSWNENLEKAIEQAKKENKAVLVNFTGSDWCIRGPFEIPGIISVNMNAMGNYYYFVLVISLISIFILYRIVNSPFGLTLKGIRVVKTVFPLQEFL